MIFNSELCLIFINKFVIINKELSVHYLVGGGTSKLGYVKYNTDMELIFSILFIVRVNICGLNLNLTSETIG